jgi:hypothetical protein
MLGAIFEISLPKNLLFLSIINIFVGKTIIKKNGYIYNKGSL